MCHGLEGDEDDSVQLYCHTWTKCNLSAEQLCNATEGNSVMVCGYIAALKLLWFGRLQLIAKFTTLVTH